MDKGENIKIEIGFWRSVVNVDIVRIREENIKLEKRIVEDRIMEDKDMGIESWKRNKVKRNWRKFIEVWIEIIEIKVEIDSIKNEIWKNLIENDRERKKKGRVE